MKADLIHLSSQADCLGQPARPRGARRSAARPARGPAPLFDLASDQPLRQRRAGEGLIVDLFAGAGGASVGMEQGFFRAIDIAVNHDPVAIDVHARNHPQTRHYRSDIFEVDPLEATGGAPVDVLWASPDCTSFSTSKGRAPIKRYLRALPWVVPRWIAATRPRFVVMENVTPIRRDWGKLVAYRKDGVIQYNPDGTQQLTSAKHPRHRARHWRRFIAHLQRLGYAVHVRELNAADYGAGTSRKRLFLIASRDHEAVTFPEPTHLPANTPETLLGLMQPWVGAWQVIDFRRPTTSILNRAEPLAPNSNRRIAVGVLNLVLAHEDPFVIEGGTLAGLVPQNAQNRPVDLREPAPTLTTQTNRVTLLDVTTHQLPFLSKYYGDAKGSKNAHCVHITRPTGTITTVDHHALADVHTATVGYLIREFGTSNANPLTDPVGTIVTSGRGKTKLAEVPTVCLDQLTPEQREMARQVHAFMTATLPESAHFTLPGHQALGRVIGGEVHVLLDIRTRMLEPTELKLAQGFPRDYHLTEGRDTKEVSKTRQIKLIGNSVPPPFAAAIARSLQRHLDHPASIRPLPAWLASRRQRETTALQKTKEPARGAPAEIPGISAPVPSASHQLPV